MGLVASMVMPPRRGGAQAGQRCRELDRHLTVRRDRPCDVTTIAIKRTDWVETAILAAIPPALRFGLACLAACGGY